MRSIFRAAAALLISVTLLLSACSGQITVSGQAGDGNGGDDSGTGLGLGILGEDGTGEGSEGGTAPGSQNAGRTGSSTLYFLVLAVIILAIVAFSFMLR